MLLNGNRYAVCATKNPTNKMNNNWTYKKLGELVSIHTGKLDANAANENGKYPFFTCAITPLRINSYSYDCECVLIAGNGDLNVKYYNGKFDAYQRTYIIEKKPDVENVLIYYIYYFFQTYIEELRYRSIGGIIKYIKLGDLTNAIIPIPPLSEQEVIVRELDLIHSIIDKKNEQLRELDKLAQSVFYTMFGDPIINDKNWEVKKLGEIAPCIKFSEDIYSKEGKYWLLNLDMVESNTGNIIDYLWVEKDEIGNSTTTFNEKYVLYSKLRPYLNKVVLPIHSGYCTTELLPLLPDKSLHRIYLAHLLRSDSFVKHISLKVAGAKMPRVTMDDFRGFLCPLPPLSLQQEFAKKVEAIEVQKELIRKSIAEVETLLASRMQHYFG